MESTQFLVKRLHLSAIVITTCCTLLSCYSFAPVHDIESLSPNHVLRVTLTDGRVINIYSWAVDSLGTISGVYQAVDNRDHPIHISPEQIAAIEARESDESGTAVSLFLFLLPVALIVYYSVSWH